MEIKDIISLTHHCLHLCNNLNMDEIVFSSVMDTDTFVTTNTELWTKKFKDNNINCRIKKPGVVKPNERIVVDATSFGQDFGIWEERWKNQAKVICIYNIDKIDKNILTNLIDIHDKMVLSVNKLWVFSDKNLERNIDKLSPELVESLVKGRLRNILVSMLLLQSMCGADLIKLLYQKFNVFISPGQLYPTLHELEKEGLLVYEYNLKSKVYSIKEKEKAEFLLENHARANSILSEMLLKV